MENCRVGEAFLITASSGIAVNVMCGDYGMRAIQIRGRTALIDKAGRTVHVITRPREQLQGRPRFAGYYRWESYHGSRDHHYVEAANSMPIQRQMIELSLDTGQVKQSLRLFQRAVAAAHESDKHRIACQSELLVLERELKAERELPWYKRMWRAL